MDDSNQPPHTYKTQRRYERIALAGREDTVASGGTLPPVCGYTYVPRASKRYPNMKRVPVTCMRNSGAGTNHLGKGYCDYHEWLANKEVDKAGVQVRKAKEQAYKESTFLGLPRPVDPHTAMMEEVQRSAGMVEWLRQRMAEKAELYEQEAAKSDDPYHPGSDALLVQWIPKAGQQPSAWWILYQEEREHLIRACTAAIKAGVAERRVQIAEQQGQIIVALFYSFIHDPELGLMPEQIMRAPELIRKHMAALPRAGDDHSKTQGIIEAVAHG